MDKTLILRELREYFNFTSDVEFAQQLGISPQNLSQWQKRNTYDVAKVATAFPDVNERWLLTGEGEMLKPIPKIYNMASPEKLLEMLARRDQQIARRDQQIDKLIELLTKK